MHTGSVCLLITIDTKSFVICLRMGLRYCVRRKVPYPKMLLGMRLVSTLGVRIMAGI